MDTVKKTMEYAKKTLIYFFTVCVLISFVFLSGCTSKGLSGRNQPVAVKGVIDLRDWDFENEGMAELNGEWEFYWEKLLTPEDFTKQAPEKSGYIKVPGRWSSFKVEAGDLPPSGYATYRLTVLLGKGLGESALAVRDIRSAYTLWIDDSIQAINGKVGTSKNSMDPSQTPRIVRVKPSGDTLTILVQTSNYGISRGGMVDAVTFGKESQILRDHDVRMGLDIMIFGILLIMGLYHFTLFILRRNDPSLLIFSCICFLIAVKTVMDGERYIMILFPGMDFDLFYKMWHLTYYALVPLIVMFIAALFPDTRVRPVVIAYQVIGFIFSLMVVVFPVSVFIRSVPWYHIVTMTAIIYTIAVICRAVIKKQDGAVFVMLCFIVLVIAGTSDMLSGFEIVHTPQITLYGLVLYIFLQSVFLSTKFARAFYLVENMSAELTRKNEALLNFDKMKDEFLANTSHELKTPLNGIIGIAESLIDGASGPLLPRTQDNLSLIVSSGRRLSNLVNDILDMSKLRDNNLQLNTQPIQLGPIVDAVIKLTAPLWKGKNIEVVNLIPEDAPPVLADPNRLEQIFMNLVGNAIKFTDSGGIDISSVVIPGDENGFMEISVTDTGIGISGDKIDRMFNLFEQGDGSIIRAYGGTGLGLPITKSLVELHGGVIALNSREGAGTTIRFTLPISKTPMVFIRKTLAEAVYDKVKGAAPFDRNSWEGLERRSGFDRRKRMRDRRSIDAAMVDTQGENLRGNVLIADDDKVNAQVLENTLELANYSVESVSDGAAVLEFIENFGVPDLVILDIMMPRMSGYDVCRKIRNEFSLYELPVLMLTAKNRSEDLLTGFNAGANDYLYKPMDKHELLARVSNLISIKKTAHLRLQITSIENELIIARNIQRSIIPEKLPMVSGFDIQVKYYLADLVGGDFYNFYSPGSGKLGVLIADPSGHGIPAALIAGMINITFSFLQTDCADTIRILNGLNDNLKDKLGNNFLTATYIYIDMEKGVLVNSRAGHPPVLIVKKSDGKIHSLNPTGRMIADIPGFVCDYLSINVEIGDRIIMYTDGIFEVENSNCELYGEERLIEFIKANMDLTAKEFCDRYLENLYKWSERKTGLDDDLTLIVVDLK